MVWRQSRYNRNEEYIYNDDPEYPALFARLEPIEKQIIQLFGVAYKQAQLKLAALPLAERDAMWEQLKPLMTKGGKPKLIDEGEGYSYSLNAEFMGKNQQGAKVPKRTISRYKLRGKA